MKTAITLSAIIAVSAVLGCAGSSQQVQVKGADEQLVRLAGNWTGNYKGIDSGRTGTIKFDLTVGRHTAEGEVLMYADGQLEPNALPIEFVEIEGDRVSGTVGPYVDPQCQCEVETQFLGDLEGNVIDGTFVTRISALNAEQTGLWTVSREN